METKDIKMMHDFTSLNEEINKTVPVSVMGSYILLAKSQLLDVVCKFEKADADTMYNVSNINGTLSILERWVNAIWCVDECICDNHPDVIRNMITDVEDMAKETVGRLREKLKEATNLNNGNM